MEKEKASAEKMKLFNQKKKYFSNRPRLDKMLSLTLSNPVFFEHRTAHDSCIDNSES